MKKLLLSVLAVLTALGCAAQQDVWQQMKEVEKQIVAPTFKNTTYNIVDFGAKEGIEEYMPNAKAINDAIDKCSAEGGGKVLVPAGVFYTGPITLKSNVNLHISEGATLRFSTNPNDYLPLVLTSWEGWECMNYRPLIYAYEQENIAITGKGILDGQASAENWWPWKGKEEYGYKEGMPQQEFPSSVQAKNGRIRNVLDLMDRANIPVSERIMGDGFYLRPSFIEPYLCKNILLEDFTLNRAPFWLLHPMISENITVRNLILDSHGPNNDGCDPESSKNILIEGCYFNTGDDCIAIKSGKNGDGRRRNIPSENIIVRKCIMKDGHAAAAIGSEISGGFRNLWVEDCEMDSPNLERIIRVKSNPLRGGDIQNLFVRNLNINRCEKAIFYVEMKYEKQLTGDFMPSVRNVQISNVNSQSSEYGIFIDGFEGKAQVSNVVIKDCNFNGVKRKNTPNRIVGVENMIFDNVRINGELVEYNN